LSSAPACTVQKSGPSGSRTGAEEFCFFLVAAIVLFAVNGDTRGAGIVAFVGTVASGLATTWIVKQRNDASKEKEKALKLVEQYCSEPAKTVTKLDEGANPADLVVPIA
jgi:UDP-N-acetylmuramyl tripeptide synthase